MEISELALRVLLLFFPGVVCYLVVEALTIHHKRQVFEVFLLTFLYGVASYASFAVIVAFFSIVNSGIHVPPPRLSIMESLTDSNKPIDFLEIGAVAAVSFVVAILISYFRNRKVLHNFAIKWGITKRFGDLDVWDFAMNADAVRWAVVRDIANKRMFEGYVRAFSDAEETRELLLTDVVVYNEKTGRKLFEADSIYLSRRRDDLTVEFPNPPPRC